ncbi:MAG: hypothetical protein LUB63_03890 [Oscillospiraceae bacterium]|nr:hypothetical protein [Oscillospiraceae bacterium]
MKKEKKKMIAILLAVLIVLAVAGTLLGYYLTGPHIAAYADAEIRIVGLLEEDFTITPAELLSMDCVYATATGKSEKAGMVSGYGPTLDTFLAQYGVALDEIKAVRVCCADDYTILLGRTTWDKYDIVLSVANGRRALKEYHQPLRLVIPGADSGKWAYMVTEMDFTYYD